jgi:hypothetical protein
MGKALNISLLNITVVTYKDQALTLLYSFPRGDFEDDYKDIHQEIHSASTAMVRELYCQTTYTGMVSVREVLTLLNEYRQNETYET